MKFKDILAHDGVKQRLTSMVDSRRIPHAILIEGQPGIGKFLLARALAQYIHCTNRTGGDSCGVCPSCKQHQSLQHVDTHFVYPVLKGKSSSALSADYAAEWNEFIETSPFMDFRKWVELLGNINGQPIIYVDESASLIRKLNYAAAVSDYKVVVLWLPERLQESAANKLLKLIEEPHDDTIFIMVSNDAEKILPTIYSRLHRVKVRPLDEDTIAGYLQEDMGLDSQTASEVAHLAQGTVLNALKLVAVDKADDLNFTKFVELMRLAYQRDVIKLKVWAEDLAAGGRDSCINFVRYCERMIGENFVNNLQNPALVYMNQEENKFSRNFARFINERNVMQLRRLFIEARTDIEGNTNARMVMFDVAVKTILLIKQ